MIGSSVRRANQLQKPQNSAILPASHGGNRGSNPLGDATPLVDGFLRQDGNSRNFLKAALEFDFVCRGENLFCFNNALLKKYA